MGFEEAFNQSGLTARLLDFGIDYSLFMILHPEEDITRIIAFFGKLYACKGDSYSERF